MLGRRYQHVAQTFNHPLGVQIACLVFLWSFINVDRKCPKKSLKIEKIHMIICGINYYITKLKTKLDVLPLISFNHDDNYTSPCLRTIHQMGSVSRTC